MSAIKIDLEDNFIHFSGILTFDTSVKAFEEAKKKFPKKGKVVLDFSKVTRSDSSGVAVLTGLMRFAKKNKIDLKISGVPRKMMDLARVSGVDDMIILA